MQMDYIFGSDCVISAMRKAGIFRRTDLEHLNLEKRLLFPVKRLGTARISPFFTFEARIPVYSYTTYYCVVASITNTVFDSR